jgi:subtilisin family serine protease
MRAKMGSWGSALGLLVALLSCNRVSAQSTPELREELGVRAWHGAGVKGAGVTIGVLDRGFRGFRDFLGKTLPKDVLTHSCRRDGDIEGLDSQHGIRCAEVLHALAPEARLCFLNWEPNDPDTFLEAVRWARAKGVQVLTCSLNMPNWSDGAGGGPVHDALAQLLGDGSRAGDMLLFASVGNFAQRHWSGPVRLNNQKEHEWATGYPANRIVPWGKVPVTIEFYGTCETPLEMLVCERESGATVARSLVTSRSNSSVPWSQAAAMFEPRPERTYELRVRPRGQSAVRTGERFHVVALGGFLEHTTPMGSIVFPADGAHVVGLGAVDHAKKRLAYSSCGALGQIDKPSLVARVPFPVAGREPAFSGTSAAAPQAAALAALLWCERPQWLAGHVRQRLHIAAEDLLEPGWDEETGYGLIRLPKR